MNPYQVMGIIVCCTIVFAGVVTFLTMQGVHILQAFIGVYLVAVWCMLSMQRKARENFDFMEDLRQRRDSRTPLRHRVHTIDVGQIDDAATATAERAGV
ncbi:MAG: hypothetical protein AB8B79_17795 [Granulosicoccus sp.]